MSAPKHTPGSLAVLPDDEGFPGALRVAHGPTRQAVCWRVHNPADALLIAAAPDLLAVCLEIAGDPRCDLVTTDRRIRLYHAIQKAGGDL